MEDKEKNMVQKQIGYSFHNTDLLEQAFVRRSFSKENGGGDNEVLEFIGDKILDACVMRYLIARFGYMADAYAEYKDFLCHYTEGQLTQFKARMVSKKSLAKRIADLGFAGYLIMGKGDSRNNVDEEDSVREDLFEAIIGAVTIDSNWDYTELQTVVELMLNPDSFLESDEENYVQLIQDWNEKEYNAVPEFQYSNPSYYVNAVPWGYKLEQNVTGYGLLMASQQYICEWTLEDEKVIFRASGKSKPDARKNVCKLAYEWLDKNDKLYTIRDEIENPNKDQAINQLETLARRGYFSIPTYEFKEDHDEDGNPVWTAECHIEEEDIYYFESSSSKKEAKKQAAYDMLMHVLGLEEEEDD